MQLINLCDRHRCPAGVPISSVPRAKTFNERIQADTLWVQLDDKKRAVPILMISDASTRLLAAHYLPAEDSDNFILALEKRWVSHFGPPQILQVDEHRAWSSERMRAWTSEQGIELLISPGQSHTHDWPSWNVDIKSPEEQFSSSWKKILRLEMELRD